MKDHDTNRHPGPWRVMRVDSEFAGIILAVGFLAMGLVSMRIGTWFVLGGLALGATFALLLRYTPKNLITVMVVTVIVLLVIASWWVGRPPQRPKSVSLRAALYLEPNSAWLKLHNAGYWLDCWFDKNANVDRCRITDAKGTPAFEDIFLPCVGQTPLPQSELVLNKRWIGSTWTQSEKGINVPNVYVTDGQILLPRSLYAEARQQVYCSGG